MQVLHALWYRTDDASPALFLWGEDGAAGAPRRKDGLHPRAVATDALLSSAEQLAPHLAGRAQEATVAVRLPSLPDRPLLSPVLEDPLAAALAGETETRPWHVRGLRLEAEDAAPWLCRLGSGEAGVLVGSDLAAWAEAARFLLSLLARERLVPSLELIQAGAVQGRASWAPALDDPRDAERLARLVRALPPSARASGDPPPGAREALLEFLHLGAGGLAGRWLGLVPKSRAAAVPAGVPGAWLEALRAGRSRVEGAGASLLRLREDLASWRRKAGDGALSGWRTCLRLQGPPDGNAGAGWSLTFHLQSVEDPSLLVPAELVWSAPDRLPAAAGLHPQDRLLGDLGRCVETFPPLSPALRQSRPGSCALSPQDVVSFLGGAAARLQERGIAIQLPAGLGSQAQPVTLRLELGQRQSSSSGLFGLETLVDYRWQVSLGDDQLDAREFRRLAELKVPLVQVRGQWVLLEPEQVQRALALLGEKPGRMALGKALRLASGVEAPGGLPVEAAFHGALAGLAGGEALRSLEAPASFRGELRPYQVRGLSWLAWLRDRGLGACLADDMGLGKTIQLIAVLLRDRERGDKGPVLLVCPTSVVGNWVRELERFSPDLQVEVHHGTARSGNGTFAARALGMDVVVTTYALARLDQEHLRQVEWRGVVLDEAQNIKNPDAGQSRAVRSLTAGFRVALTGTPVENRLTDLWSLMEFLNPGLLGPRLRFEREFAPAQGRGLDRLRRVVQPFLLRRVKTDPTLLPELPEKQESKTWCPLTREQATLYQATVQAMLEQIEGSEQMSRRGLVLSTLLRLKQICNHPAQFLADGSALAGRSGKLGRLEEMLEEVLAEGDRALVFTQFAELAEALAGHLRERFGRPVLCLTGKVGRRERDAMVELFQSAQGPPLFVLSLKAGGVGLNLTRASRVFHFDRWWNPAVENQATDRAFRLGQTRGVQVYKFLCQGTLEEAIDRLIESKSALAESVVGTGEHWLTELDDRQLREILTLREEAVEA